MTPQRWTQIDRVFQAAVEVPPEQRAAFLDAACEGDPQLREEVESLLGFDEVADDRFATVVQKAAVSATAEPATVEDQRIGPYEIIREIGRGGMGSVYLATRADDTFKKQVALKIVKRGMDTDEVLHRFRHERQILAGLEHPNIARLLDGGATSDGRPYFVMEYVEGKPVTLYVRERKLPVRERVELFQAVCGAVAAAHQNLVVHRDIKPGNILVTAEGVPKLLDFGIAKVLQRDASPAADTRTMTGLRLFTPDYASPEQIRGDPITTSADVYSLGVLLYELLADKPPFDFTTMAFPEALRVVCEVDPRAPSIGTGSGRADVDEDLDTIVLMAMRKEPARRYDSVQHFADDLQRYLDGLPVLARKDSMRYRASKFVRRNTGGVIAAALVLLALTGGFVAAAYQARVAERRFTQLRHLANAFLFDFHDSIQSLPGATKARELVVRRGLEYLDGLAAEARGDADLQRELAEAYRRVGDVQGHPTVSNLGDSAGALKSYAQAARILEKLPETDGKARVALAKLETTLGTLKRNSGDTAGGIASYRRALGIFDRMQQVSPSRETLGEIAVLHDHMGRALLVAGDAKGALESAERSLTIQERLAGANPGLEQMDAMATTRATLGMLLSRSNRLEEAAAHVRTAAALREKANALQPDNARNLRNLMISYGHLGDTLGNPNRPNLGDFAGAVTAYTRSYDIASQLVNRDPNDRRLRLDLSLALMRMGSSALAAGDRTAAGSHLRRALAIQEAGAAADPANSNLVRNLAHTLLRLGDLESASGATGPALGHYQRSVELTEKLAKADPASLDLSAQYLGNARVRALALAQAGQREAALRQASGLAQIAARVAAKDQSDLTRIAQPAVTAAFLGRMYTALGEKERGNALIAESASGLRQLKEQGKLSKFMAAMAGVGVE